MVTIMFLYFLQNFCSVCWVKINEIVGVRRFKGSREGLEPGWGQPPMLYCKYFDYFVSFWDLYFAWPVFCIFSEESSEFRKHCYKTEAGSKITFGKFTLQLSNKIAKWCCPYILTKCWCLNSVRNSPFAAGKLGAPWGGRGTRLIDLVCESLQHPPSSDEALCRGTQICSIHRGNFPKVVFLNDRTERSQVVNWRYFIFVNSIRYQSLLERVTR